MSKILKYLIVFLMLSLNLISQTSLNIVNMQIPNVILVDPTTLDDTYWNSANLSKIDSSKITLTYNPSKFGISSLSFSSLQYLLHIDGYSISPQFSGSINSLYSEYSFAIKNSYKVNDKITLAADIDLANISIKNYSSEYALMLNLSGLVEFSKTLSAGFSIKNLNRTSYSRDSKTIYQSAIFGLGFAPMEDLKLALNTVIFLNHETGISLAGSYLIYKQFLFKLAYLTNPATFSIGAVKTIEDNLFIGINMDYHTYLGWSVGFNFGLDI